MISVRAEMIALGIIKPAVGPDYRPVECPHCRRVLPNDERYAKHLKEVHAK